MHSLKHTNAEKYKRDKAILYNMVKIWNKYDSLSNFVDTSKKWIDRFESVDIKKMLYYFDNSVGNSCFYDSLMDIDFYVNWIETLFGFKDEYDEYMLDDIEKFEVSNRKIPDEDIPIFCNLIFFFIMFIKHVESELFLDTELVLRRMKINRFFNDYEYKEGMNNELIEEITENFRKEVENFDKHEKIVKIIEFVKPYLYGFMKRVFDVK